METKRNSNIELLRIISMIMILLSHYTLHNGINNYSLPLGFNRLILEITTLGRVGVYIFVLITGYYSIEQKNPFKIKKLFFLWLEVFFYSLGVYLFLVFIIRCESFSLLGLIEVIFPISFNCYWFMSAYFLLYIFIPFINIFINSLNKRKHLELILICLLFFSILKTVTDQDLYANDLVQFIYIYIIGAYLKKYNNVIPNSFFKGLFICTSIFLFMITIVFDLLGMKIPFFGMHSIYLFYGSSPFAILLAISIFGMFINNKYKSIGIVNSISSNILAVYLISDNNYIRKYLWTNVLKNYLFINSKFLVIHMLICIVVICTFCIIIDFIRKNTFEKLFKFLYEKVVYIVNLKYIKSINAFFDKIYSFL